VKLITHVYIIRNYIAVENCRNHSPNIAKCTGYIEKVTLRKYYKRPTEVS